MAEVRNVARYNYGAQFPDIDQLLDSLREALVAGRYILSPEVTAFESALADFVGTEHAVGVNSGTDALILAMHAMGIGPGDEVITVTNSFHATALAAVRVGATPVFVDCDIDTMLMTPGAVEQAITAKTRAVAVVHLFGQALDLAPFQDLCRRHNLLLIEDCAQAIGARANGRPVGSIGDAGCWSFAPSKNLAAAGDGGAVTTNDPSLDADLRRLRHFGQEGQNDHRSLGYNSRLDTLQALVLLQKLPMVERWNQQRVDIARSYRDRLGRLPIAFQEGAAEGGHVYHLFQIRVPRRDQLLEFLRERGVDAIVRYPVPMHLQPAFEPLGYNKADLPNSVRLSTETLCLPIRPDLSAQDIEYVCDSVDTFFSSGKAPRAERLQA